MNRMESEPSSSAAIMMMWYLKLIGVASAFAQARVSIKTFCFWDSTNQPFCIFNRYIFRCAESWIYIIPKTNTKIQIVYIITKMIMFTKLRKHMAIESTALYSENISCFS